MLKFKSEFPPSLVCCLRKKTVINDESYLNMWRMLAQVLISPETGAYNLSGGYLSRPEMQRKGAK